MIFYLLSSWIPFLVWAGIIFYLSSIPHVNSGLGIWDFVLRKLAHMTEYSGLFLLFARAAHRTWARWSSKRIITIGLIFCLLYALSDEYHQSFVPGRDASLKDVTIDFVSSVLAVILYRQWMRKYAQEQDHS